MPKPLFMTATLTLAILIAAAVIAPAQQGMIFSTRSIGDKSKDMSITNDRAEASLLVNHAIQIYRDFDLEANQ